MTLPNKLTLVRIVLSPVFFILFMVYIRLPEQSFLLLAALWIVLLMSELTDFLDGHIARSRNLVSDMGKQLDPFSDVICRVTYFVCFAFTGLMPLWALIIIIWREYSIMFIRNVMAKEGEALAARSGGKLKAVVYFISGTWALLHMSLEQFDILPGWFGYVTTGLFIAGAALALISFIDYFRLYMQKESYKKFLAE